MHHNILHEMFTDNMKNILNKIANDDTIQFQTTASQRQALYGYNSDLGLWPQNTPKRGLYAYEVWTQWVQKN